MKCPKCGSVSSPGNDHCEKCGQHFSRARDQSNGNLPLLDQSIPEGGEPGENHVEIGGYEGHGLDVALEPEAALPGAVELEEGQPTPQPPQTKSARTWQEELADRVQEYRQRRARIRNGEKDNHETPNFDFGSPTGSLEADRPNLIEFPSVQETVQRHKSTPGARSDSPAFALEDFEVSTQNQVGGVHPAPGIKAESSGETGPLEIELGSSLKDSVAGIGIGEPAAVPIAPMSMRFFAGFIDALVLFLGAAVYALIFRQAGGHFSPHPLLLAAAAVAAAFFIMLYFGGCIALASATPGLIWAGLEVCTFEGETPRPADCFWRAFGYLVSMSALMLGFIWAAVDADGLTWHDRMSRTLIVPADSH